MSFSASIRAVFRQGEGEADSKLPFLHADGLQAVEQDSEDFDSAETAKRKAELVDSIELHHRVDTSTDVPILHVFLTAKKEPLEAYRKTQSKEGGPPKGLPEQDIFPGGDLEGFPHPENPGKQGPVDEKELMEFLARRGERGEPARGGFRESIIEQAILEFASRQGLVAPMAPPEIKKVPADITRFSGDNDRRAPPMKSLHPLPCIAQVFLLEIS